MVSWFAAHDNTHTKIEADPFDFIHYRTGLQSNCLHAFGHSPLRMVKGLNSDFSLLYATNNNKKNCDMSSVNFFIFDPAVTDPVDIVIEWLLHGRILSFESDLRFQIK